MLTIRAGIQGDDFIVDLVHVKRASRAPWVRIFRKLSIQENLVTTWRMNNRAPTTCKPMPNVRLFWRESIWPPASCEADD